MHDDDWFTLAELTQRLGGLVWVEEQLAVVLDVWAAVEAAPAVAVHLRTAGGHHRWHGQVMRQCLPTSPRLHQADPVVAPTSGWTRTIATLTDLTDADATVPRLKALVRVVAPWLDRELGALLELARPVSDAPMIRWLRFLMLDHVDDGEAASLLLSSQASAAVSVQDHRVITNLDLT